MARKPCSPAARNSSRGAIPSRSHCSWYGTISLSTKRRKLSRNSSCSSSNRVRRIRAKSSVREVDFETVLYEVRDHVATVTLNRPEKLNSFNERMCQEFEHIWRTVRHDDDIHVAVLRAAGDRA